MSDVLAANIRTRLLGLWDEHKALLEEYEELRESMFPEGGIVFFDAGALDIDFADGDEGELDGEVAA